MYTAAILTLSDKGSRGERDDKSGPAIEDCLRHAGFSVKYYEILADEKDLIKEKLLEFCKKVDLIVTTGGTGLSPRDVTPDATLEVIEKIIPGIPEAIRMEGLTKTKRAMLSRAVAGVRGTTLIVNLPGSPSAIKESLTIIADVIPHAIEKIQGSTEDCAATERTAP